MLFAFGFAQDDKEDTCPEVQVKSQNQCATTVRKPICWSPGVEDVDCPTGNPNKPFGLCCFDGCQNSCLDTPTCQKLFKNATKIVEKEKCTQESREVCQPETTTICKNDCKNITTNVMTTVPEEVCISEVLKECRNITTEVT